MLVFPHSISCRLISDKYLICYIVILYRRKSLFILRSIQFSILIHFYLQQKFELVLRWQWESSISQFKFIFRATLNAFNFQSKIRFKQFEIDAILLSYVVNEIASFEIFDESLGMRGSTGTTKSLRESDVIMSLPCIK